MTALPAVLAVNFFIVILEATLTFCFDYVPDFWWWAKTGTFKHMSSED
jgi:hypothetical protein